MDIISIENKVVPVVAKMELHGVKINTTLLETTKLKLIQLKSDYRYVIEAFSSNEININSNDQLSELLFEDLRITPLDETLNKKGNYKVDKAHLLKLKDEHEIIALILKHRKVDKLLKFCDQLNHIHPKTGRLHATLNQIGTETGRFSSSKPNLQNIPNRKLEGDDKNDELKVLESKFRQMFIPRKGWQYICSDYSQIELRVIAHYSQDHFMLKAYNDKQDLHTLTASEIFNVQFEQVTEQQRKIAKSINFGLIYGKTAYGLAASLSQITGTHYTVEQAQQTIDDYFNKFSGVKTCLDALIDQADERGYSTTLYGRKRPISQLQSNKLSERNAGKRIAMNSPIQGTAADIIKIAMIKCDAEITAKGLKSKMILTVHDELLFEVPEEEMDIMRKLVKETMENAVELTVPLEVGLETGTNWAMAH